MVGARNFLNNPKIKGIARDFPTNSLIPKLGAVVKTNESEFGHLGVVIDFTETTVTMYESNNPLGSNKAGIRTLQLNDKKILGFYIF